MLNVICWALHLTTAVLSVIIVNVDMVCVILQNVTHYSERRYAE
jgi:hypothetical protein